MKRYSPYIYSVAMAALLLPTLLLAGCVMREPGETGDGSDVPVKFGVNMLTRSITWDTWEVIDENGAPTGNTLTDGIDSIRVIAANSQYGAIMYNKIFKPADFDTSSAVEGVYGTTTIELHSGTYDFFVIANDRFYGDDLNAATNISQVLNMKVAEVEIDGSDSGQYPPGKIVYEGQMFPFPRSVYIPGVQVGNYSDLEGINQIKLPGSSVWTNILEFSLDHLSPRVNISIRKDTKTVYDGVTGNLVSHENDRLYIRGLRLLQVPNFAYMNPKPYNISGGFNSVVWYEFDGVTPEPNDYFTSNNSGIDPANPPVVTPDGLFRKPDSNEFYARSGRQDIVIPEYILGSVNNKEDNAIMLEVVYGYEKWNPDKIDTETGLPGDWDDIYEGVWAVIPLVTEGTYDAPVSYEFLRNRDYHIMMTITQISSYEFVPQIEILSYGWDEDVHGRYNAGNAGVAISGRWTKGAPDAGGKLYVDYPDAVEYTFTFTRSDANDNSIINWKAVLTNPVDFGMAAGSTAGGYARPGETCKVRVTPTAPASDENTTKLYINISDGAGGVKRLPLNAADNYVIYQNPN